MADAQAKVRACSVCGSLDVTDPLRHLLGRPRATGRLLCVVEEVGSIWAMERGGSFKGRYHVLGGLLSALGRGSGRTRCASPSWRPAWPTARWPR